MEKVIVYRWISPTPLGEGWFVSIYDGGETFVPCDLDLDLYEKKSDGAALKTAISQKYPEFEVKLQCANCKDFTCEQAQNELCSRCT